MVTAALLLSHCRLFGGQFDLLARMFERAVRDTIVEVHDEAQCHPDGEAHQRQDAELEYQIDVDGDGDGRHEGQGRGEERKGVSEVVWVMRSFV